MKTLSHLVAAVIAVASAPNFAKAAAILDCPLRDAPFSLGLPLIDVLNNAQAKALLAQAAPGRIEKMPPQFMSGKAPTFAAILTPREFMTLAGVSEANLPQLDADLRKIPVTDADRALRCERYDNDRPTFAFSGKGPRLLLFEKINGFKDTPGFNAAHDAFVTMAKRKGWQIAITDKGGAFTPKTLRQFDAVIWNNISGDVLTLQQRQAFEDYIQGGGGFVGVHGSAGDPVYFWDWYVDRLIGARFMGHTIDPQYQDARIVVEDRSLTAARRLPREWVMNDEWYSFSTNPRTAGASIIAKLDESSYSPKGYGNQDIHMGDHPIAWTNCEGKGKTFYSAIGHRPEGYSQPNYVAMLEDGISWVLSDARCTPTAETKP